MKHARKDYQDRVVDLLNIIPPDEPVFLIRGQDKLAPHIVEEWADLAERVGASKDIVQAAREQANAMREWQLTHPSKIPDMP